MPSPRPGKSDCRNVRCSGCSRCNLRVYAARSTNFGWSLRELPFFGRVDFCNRSRKTVGQIPLNASTRRPITTAPPSFVHFMPERFSRCANTVLHAASVTPLPMGKPAARYLAYFIQAA